MHQDEVTALSIKSLMCKIDTNQRLMPKNMCTAMDEKYSIDNSHHAELISLI